MVDCFGCGVGTRTTTGEEVIQIVIGSMVEIPGRQSLLLDSVGDNQ